jgi:hypothetical protein
MKHFKGGANYKSLGTSEIKGHFSWLFVTTWTITFPGNESVMQKPMTLCGTGGRRDRQT